MQQKSPRKLNSQFAIDFGVLEELPVGCEDDKKFSRGYTIGAATFFCLVIASFVNIYFSLNDATRVARGVGYLLASVGTSFVFVIAYQMVQRIGIKVQNSVIDPRRNPALFWSVSFASIVFFLIFAGSGVWLCCHAAWVAKRFS